MEVGTCSCIRGVRGAEYKHQAAIAKNCKIYSVNISPFFSNTAKTFARFAVGKSKEMQLEFYADLRDDSQSPSSNYGADNIEYLTQWRIPVVISYI